MGSKKELKLASSLENLYLVEQFVEEISDEYHLNDNYFSNIMIAVTEAVRNAIIHGNRQDPSKQVHVMVESKAKGLVFTVIDQGEGFNTKRFTDLDQLLVDARQEGRGIMILHSVSDEVKFSNKGRVVEIFFRISGIDNKILEQRQEMLESYLKTKKKIDSPHS